MYVYESSPFIVEDGEELELSPINICKAKSEGNNIASGILLKKGQPAEGHILKIYRVSKGGKKVFVGFTTTDSFGQFTIPLSSKRSNYVIKVFSLKEETTGLELIIKN